MKSGRQELQDHIATQAGVLGLINHTHPTAAQFLCDFVVGDGLADHGVGTRRLSSSNQFWTNVVEPPTLRLHCHATSST